MRKLALLYEETVLEHQPHSPFGVHPERPARVRETFSLLESSGVLKRLTRLPVRPASRAEMELVHSAAYLDFVERVVSEGGGVLDSGDTVVSSRSWEAVTYAAGRGSRRGRRRFEG